MFGCSIVANAQLKKMGRSVTNKIEHEVAPVMSTDGKRLLYMVKESHGRGWRIRISRKNGNKFKRGTNLVEINKSATTNLMGAYCINISGSELYFTSKKYGGVGGYDIWMAKEKPNGTYSDIQNIAKPINSKSNDGMPSISADGKFLYFMRSESMEDPYNVQGEIWVSKRGKNGWGTPTKLPFEGVYSYPKIFASNNYLLLTKIEGKKMSYYYSKKVDGVWQAPKKITSLEAGSLKHPYATMSHNDKKIYFSTYIEGEATSDLYQANLTEEERPSPITYFQLQDKEGQGKKCRMSIYDLATNETVIKQKIEGTNNFAYLEAGKKYDIYIHSFAKDELFHHEVYDATKKQKISFAKRPMTFRKLQEGDTLDFTNYIEVVNDVPLFKSPKLAKELAKFLNKSPYTYTFLQQKKQIKADTSITDSIGVTPNESTNTHSTVNTNTRVSFVMDSLVKAGLKPEKYEVKEIEEKLTSNSVKLLIK